jgi:hypothetical protein
MTVMVDSTSTLGLQTRLDAVACGNSSDHVPVTYLVPGTSIAAEKHPSGGMTGGLEPTSTREFGSTRRSTGSRTSHNHSSDILAEQKKRGTQTQSSDPVPERNTAKMPKHCYYRALPGSYNARSGVTRIRQRPPRQENDEKRKQKTAHPTAEPDAQVEMHTFGSDHDGS